MKMTASWNTAPCSLAEVEGVSKVLAASIIRMMTHLLITGQLLRDYMAQYPRRHSSSYSPP
jgi:hypothetical protein